jgi:hypothetical protein
MAERHHTRRQPHRLINAHRQLTNRDDLANGVPVGRLGALDEPPNWTISGRAGLLRGDWQGSAAIQ